MGHLDILYDGGLFRPFNRQDIRRGSIDRSHTANNIFAFSISTSSGSGMPFATIFYEPEPDYMAGFIMILLVVMLHYLLYFRIFRSRFPA